MACYQDISLDFKYVHEQCNQHYRKDSVCVPPGSDQLVSLNTSGRLKCLFAKAGLSLRLPHIHPQAYVLLLSEKCSLIPTAGSTSQ